MGLEWSDSSPLYTQETVYPKSPKHYPFLYLMQQHHKAHNENACKPPYGLSDRGRKTGTSPVSCHSNGRKVIWVMCAQIPRREPDFTPRPQTSPNPSSQQFTNLTLGEKFPPTPQIWQSVPFWQNKILCQEHQHAYSQNARLSLCLEKKRKERERERLPGHYNWSVEVSEVWDCLGPS